MGMMKEFREFAVKGSVVDLAVGVIIGLAAVNIAKPGVGVDLTRGDEAAIERGRRIVKNHNCQGCHILEDHGGQIRETLMAGLM